MNANPLLDFSGLPRFDAICAEHVAPAIDTLLADARATVERVARDAHPATWANVVEPLADSLDRLDRAWSIVRHLNSVVSTPELRDAYNGHLPKVTAFHSDLGLDLRLFDRYRAIAASAEYGALDAARRRAVDNELRDFRLGGAELPGERKARLKAVQEELAALSAKFDDNVLDATNAWSLAIDDEADLAGVPAGRPRRAARRRRPRQARVKLTLRMPCYLPVIQYADNARCASASPIRHPRRELARIPTGTHLR
jgi:oligopeptidase A